MERTWRDEPAFPGMNKTGALPPIWWCKNGDKRSDVSTRVPRSVPSQLHDTARVSIYSLAASSVHRNAPAECKMATSVTFYILGVKESGQLHCVPGTI